MIVVIADDLSGAAELANIARQFGLSAELQTQFFDPKCSSQVCAFNADTRALTPSEAAARMVKAFQVVLAARPDWIFKKVDSVLRGHVGPEIEAIMDAAGLQRAILLPANPSRGRFVRAGRYFIEDTPLSNTRMKLDPEFPRYFDDIEALVATTNLIKRVGMIGPEQRQLYIPNITSTAEVTDCARSAGDYDLLAGAADFFVELLQTRFPARVRVSEFPSIGCRHGMELLICGSQHAWPERRRQADEAGIAWREAPAVAFADESDPSAAQTAAATMAEDLLRVLDATGRAVIGLSAVPISGRQFNRRGLNFLAQLAVQVSCRVSTWLLEGGATAQAILATTGHSRLQLGNPQETGIAELLAPSAEVRYFVKPGSYGWPHRVWPGESPVECKSS